MALCLASGTLAAMLSINSFTLAWTHSIEKIRWEEDWQVAGGRLHLQTARIRGSGAGMEPPADAVFKDGVWHYHPKMKPLASVQLAHSPYTAGYQLCSGGQCRALASYLSGLPATASITLRACSAAR